MCRAARLHAQVLYAMRMSQEIVVEEEYLDLPIRSDPLAHMGERTQRMIGSVDGYEQPLFVRHGELPS
jgi:hypothetical protein